MMEWICKHTGATSATRGERIQSLWSGYGEIFRVSLTGAAMPSVVVKSVQPPAAAGHHPVGWGTARSHLRKLRSYAVEHAWYQSWSQSCLHETCRVPAFLAGESSESAWLFVLEDLDASGYPGRKYDLSELEVERCLAWLANFHATFLFEEPVGLWNTGTYWHLATRPDELSKVRDKALRKSAQAIDERLDACAFKTLVHGDAKVANFCFAPEKVAAVDFQYVGGGCGIKDVAYFLSSCLSSEECEVHAARHLETYFALLRQALSRRPGPEVDVDALIAEWRTLYPWAWADFHRFLAGWSPAHWKIHGYSQRLTRGVLRTLSA